MLNERQRANEYKFSTGMFGIRYSDWTINVSVTSARVSDYVIDSEIQCCSAKANKSAAAYGITVLVYAVTCEILVFNIQQHADLLL